LGKGAQPQRGDVEVLYGPVVVVVPEGTRVDKGLLAKAVKED
jgi:hypothetical protein